MMLRSSAALGSCLLLLGCGPKLGDQSFVDASWQAELPGSFSFEKDTPGYLVLRFRSQSDLANDKINALYTKIGFCPFGATDQMGAHGPLTDTESPVWLTQPDISSPQHSYTTYLPVTGKTNAGIVNGRMRWTGEYDLRREKRDLCVVLEHTDFPLATQSDSVRISYEQWSAALPDEPG